MNDITKFVGSVIILIGAVTTPVLVISMAYSMWGWKGLLCTLVSQITVFITGFWAGLIFAELLLLVCIWRDNYGRRNLLRRR